MVSSVLKTEQLNTNYSLLVFYQSDCGHCETAIAGLESNYPDLVNKGIKIITLAADTNQETYETIATSFPWKDKFCDGQGMNGINFKNYAVMGTPKMFLLDSKGVIVEKIAAIAQLLEWNISDDN